MQVIIFKNDEGGVSVIHPTPEAVSVYGIEAIALKDVPAGKPYKIVDISNLPLEGTSNEYGFPNIDKTLRKHWDVDDEDLTDGIGADYGNGSLWVVVSMSPLIVRHSETGEVKELSE